MQTQDWHKNVHQITSFSVSVSEFMVVGH